MKKRETVFADLTFRGLTKDILLKEEHSLKVIVTVNAEFIVMAHKNDRFRKIINDNFATFDGQIPYLMAKLQNRGLYFEKISGSDLIYDIARFARMNRKRVLLLGGIEESNARTVQILKDGYGIDVAGYVPAHRPYPFDEAHNSAMLRRIEDFRPDFLLVAFGAPKQEFWIDDNREYLERIGVKWAVGVGGTFDFVAGREKRAPKFVQTACLEGLWRLIQNPKRFKRLIHVFEVFKYVHGGAPSAHH